MDILGIDFRKDKWFYVFSKLVPFRGDLVEISRGFFHDESEMCNAISDLKPDITIIDRLPHTVKVKEVQSMFEKGDVWLCQFSQIESVDFSDNSINVSRNGKRNSPNDYVQCNQMINGAIRLMFGQLEGKP